jgi:hypothetical protein
MTAAVTEWGRGVTGESPYGDRLQQEPLNDDDSRCSRAGVSRLSLFTVVWSGVRGWYVEGDAGRAPNGW